MSGSSPFTVMTNIYSLYSVNSMKTFREISNVTDQDYGIKPINGVIIHSLLIIHIWHGKWK